MPISVDVAIAWLPALFGGALAASVFLWGLLILDGGRQVLGRLLGHAWAWRRRPGPFWRDRRLRRYLQARGLTRPDPEPTATVLPEAVLLDQEGVNWQFWQMVCGGVGLALTLVAFKGISPLLTPLGAGAVFLPRIVASMRASRARWRHQTDIRTLLTSLDLLVGLGGTLEMALRQVVEQLPVGSLLARRLRHHLGQNPGRPETVLQALAADFSSPELENLTLRVEGARRGGMITYSEAVQAVARDLQERLLMQAEERIEAAPARLIMPMLFGLFPTVIVLLIYPLAVTFMAGLGMVE